MLNGIVDLIKDQALGAINSAGVPDDKKDAAVETTTSTIIDGLKDNLSLDNLSSITGLLGGNSASLASNPMVSSIQNSVVSALSSKVGLSQGVANTIATTVVPALLGLLSKKSADSKDSFNFESLIESFTGGQGGGLLGTLGKLFGK